MRLLPEPDCRVGPCAAAATPWSATLRPSAMRADDPRDAREQPGAVVALRGTAAPCTWRTSLAGEAVGDELLEVVADFDPHLSILDRQQQPGAPLSLPALADAACRGSRTSSPRTRGCPRTARRCRRSRRRSTSPLACCSERISVSSCLRAAGIDDVGEVVDRGGELRRFLRRCRKRRRTDHAGRQQNRGRAGSPGPEG